MTWYVQVESSILIYKRLLKPEVTTMVEGQSFKLAPYFMWRIEDVSSTGSLESPIFTVADVKFKMIFQQHDGQSTICMVPEVENQKLKVATYAIEVSVSIMGPDNSFKDFHFIQKTTHRNRSGFKESHLVWEVQSEILDNRDVVQEKNGKKNVTFLCVFGSLCKYQKDLTGLDAPWPDSVCMEKLSKDFGDMRLNEGSSCVLKCGHQTLKAHKIILSARSGKFAYMFRNKNKTEVEITDMKFEVLENLITYIYSGQLKDSRPSEKLLVNLYEIAYKYEVKPLIELTVNIFMDILNNDELSSTMEEDKKRLTVLALELLLKSANCNDENFKDSIMQSIILNNNFILKEDKWKEFRTNNKALAMEVYDVLSEQAKFMTEAKAEAVAKVKG